MSFVDILHQKSPPFIILYILYYYYFVYPLLFCTRRALCCTLYFFAPEEPSLYYVVYPLLFAPEEPSAAPFIILHQKSPPFIILYILYYFVPEEPSLYNFIYTLSLCTRRALCCALPAQGPPCSSGHYADKRARPTLVIQGWPRHKTLAIQPTYSVPIAGHAIYSAYLSRQILRIPITGHARYSAYL